MKKNLKIHAIRLTLFILASATGLILFPPHGCSLSAYAASSTAARQTGFTDIASSPANRQAGYIDAEGTEIKPPRLIAHAGGSIYGFRLSNSLEALNSSYSNGFRFIELDFELTRDEKIINLHDWGSTAKRYLLRRMGRVSYDKFNHTKKFMDLTLLNMDILSGWLQEHKDAFIITDVKGSQNLKVLSMIREEYEEVQGQIIPQIYSLDEYEKVSSMGYKNIILTLYLSQDKRDEILRFIKSNPLFAVTLYEEKAQEEDLVSAAADAGVPVYVHTVNDLHTYEQLRKLGVHGIYTDHFSPSYWIED